MNSLLAAISSTLAEIQNMRDRGQRARAARHLLSLNMKYHPIHYMGMKCINYNEIYTCDYNNTMLLEVYLHTSGTTLPFHSKQSTMIKFRINRFGIVQTQLVKA